MQRMRKLILVVLAAVCCCSANVYAQESESETAQGIENTSTTSISILAQPKSICPLNWNEGEKVTIGVRCVSEQATRVVGLVTDIELTATKNFSNRVELTLRGDKAAMQKVQEAAKRSEYCFEIMPFNESHRKLLANDVNLPEFLKKHTEYRIAGPEDWGFGGPGARLPAPSDDELPNR